MKYYRKKERSYESYFKANEQPCWTCSNCYGGCTWSRDGKPVAGWIAEPTYIKENVGYQNSYKIIYCPKYRKEVR